MTKSKEYAILVVRTMSQEKKKRNKEIFALRQKGISLAKIGKIHGMSKQTVYEICEREKNRKELLTPPS